MLRKHGLRLGTGLLLLAASTMTTGCGPAAGAAIGAATGAAIGSAVGSGYGGGCYYDCGYYYATGDPEYGDDW